jgi:hypothetical protein
MRSRAEVRALIESALRVLSIGLLAWMLWLAVDRDRADRVESASSATLTSSLARWSTAGVAPDRIAVELDSTPSPAARDWLAALRGAGSEVAWSGDLAPAGIEVQPVRSPRGGYTALTAARNGAPVIVSDEVGPIDTANASGGGSAFTIPSATGVISASSGKSTARALLPQPVSVKRLLVLGSAGWETKFAVLALEEDGWKVDASMYVAPGVTVTQGAVSQIDTARYSAVIALDGSAASRAGDIARYVVSGGGLVIAGSAASIEGLSALRAGSPGRMEAPEALSAEAGSTTLSSLPVIPVAGLRPDAVALDRRGAAVAVAARRHGAGRVIQTGYLDTWRWRMSGADKSSDAHRAWWTRAVASVAYAGITAPAPAAEQLSAAPVAHLVESLGVPTPVPQQSLASATGAISLWLLFGLLAASLLGEWASRRLRGMR